MVIDIHAHIYPSKIAARAVDSVGAFYVVEMLKDFAPEAEEGAEPVIRGTVEHLMGVYEGTDIQHALVHSVAVKPATVETINNFIAAEVAKRPGQLTGFMAMHQDYEDPEAEIERAMGLGLCGIKMHPDTQAVNLDDPRLMRVYEIAEKKGLPVMLHTGDYRYDYSHPRRTVNVLHTFPNLRVDAAHFGGWSIPDLALEYMENENCFMDLSSSMAFLGRRRTRELIEIYGADRIMFGSDFPMWTPGSELEVLKSLELSKLDYEKITHHTAEAYLGKEIK